VSLFSIFKEKQRDTKPELRKTLLSHEATRDRNGSKRDVCEKVAWTSQKSMTKNSATPNYERLNTQVCQGMLGLRCYGALQVRILGLCLSAHLRSVPLEMDDDAALISFFECLWRFACLPSPNKT